MTLKEQLEEKGLKLKKNKTKKDYISIYISGDVNDADYIDETSDVNVKNLDDLLLAARKMMSYEGRHNYENRYDILTEKEIYLLYDYVPWMDNHDLHTIDAIKFTLHTITGESYTIIY